MLSGILEEMTIDDVRAFKPEVVLLGVGSTEPHGPIIPYGTDFFQCDGVCRRTVKRANELGARVLMYPTLPIGNNVNFKAFPFACRIGVRTLMLVLLDIIQAIEEDGIRKIVIMDGHGGNTDAIHAALREHFDRTPRDSRAFVCMTHGMPSKEAVAAISPGSPHGGDSETSRMMYLRPDLVRTDKLQDLPLGKTLIEMPPLDQLYFVRPWHKVVPMGGGGDSRESSVDKGRALIESSADGLAAFLLLLSSAPWNPDFPYAE
jgi:creatinine amidohydrolase